MHPFIKKLREGIRLFDRFIDREVSDIVVYGRVARQRSESIAERAKGKALRALHMGRVARRKADIVGDTVVKKISQVDVADIYRWTTHVIVRHPKKILLLFIVLSSLITFMGLPQVFNNLTADMEIYLPQKGETEQIVNEIRNEPNASWSVDIIILYVYTGNALDKMNITNITDVSVLREMSYIEDSLNPNRTDYGSQDNVKFVISISTIIREVNSTPPRFKKALLDEFPNSAAVLNLTKMEGNYSIPDQKRVDDIIGYIPEDTLRSFVADSNNDSIYDTAGIIIGFNKNLSVEEIKATVDEAIHSGNITHCFIKVTGPVAITESLTARTYKEVSIILPLAVILVCLVLFAFHRSFKIIIIEIIPIVLTIGITLGILGFTSWAITPQVLFVAPVLIPLGVAYGLYIANKYTEIDEKDRRKRMLMALDKTHKPIFLSAATTAIGFASLMTANMHPMRILGFGLSVGIIIAYLVTIFCVPALILLLKYEKAPVIKPTKFVRNFPIANRKKIVAIAIAFSLFSVYTLQFLKANMNLYDLAPQDDESILTMKEYTKRFGGGQLSMFLIRGQPATATSYDFSMKDVDVLDGIDVLESRIRDIQCAKPLSIVDVMKIVRVPEELNLSQIVGSLPGFIPTPGLNLSEIGKNTSFWDAVHMMSDKQLPYIHKSARQVAMDIFYNTLSPEMRGMFVNEEYSKTLIYVDLPAADTRTIKRIVNDINGIVDNLHLSLTSTSHLTGFAPVLVEINDMLFENAFNTLAIALVLVFIILSVFFRSIKIAAITISPIIFVVGLEPLTFRMLNMDLNLLTALIGSIIVGIGIDFSIHVTKHILDEGIGLESIRRTVESIGFSFFEATLTVIVGITAVFVANIPSINQFVIMIMVLLTYSMIAALILLPAIYAIVVLKR